MSAARHTHRDRLHELLATRATEKLPAADERELGALLLEFPEVDATSLDHAAAAIDVAHLQRAGGEPLPESVRRRVESSALAFAARRRGRP